MSWVALPSSSLHWLQQVALESLLTAHSVSLSLFLPLPLPLLSSSSLPLPISEPTGNPVSFTFRTSPESDQFLYLHCYSPGPKPLSSLVYILAIMFKLVSLLPSLPSVQSILRTSREVLFKHESDRVMPLFKTWQAPFTHEEWKEDMSTAEISSLTSSPLSPPSWSSFPAGLLAVPPRSQAPSLFRAPFPIYFWVQSYAAKGLKSDSPIKLGTINIKWAPEDLTHGKRMD